MEVDIWDMFMMFCQVGFENMPEILCKLESLPLILQAIKDCFPPGSEWVWKRSKDVLLFYIDLPKIFNL